MPSRDYYLDAKYKHMVEAYRIMIRDIALEFGANPDTVDNETREIVQLETAIANVSKYLHVKLCVVKLTSFKHR